MKNLTRSTRLAVVPVVFAALALSACQDEAPSAAPPTPASPTAAATNAPTQAPETSQAPEPTQAPQTSQAPPSTESSSGGGGAGQCENTLSSAFTKGDLQAKGHDETQAATYRSNDAKADISFGKATIDTSGGDSFYPGDGMQTVIYPVTINMTSGSHFITTPLSFGLVDEGDNSCKRDVLNRVLPDKDTVQIKSLRPGDRVSAKVAFAVPAGADLSKYSLIFASDYSSGKAELAWKAK